MVNNCKEPTRAEKNPIWVHSVEFDVFIKDKNKIILMILKSLFKYNKNSSLTPSFSYHKPVATKKRFANSRENFIDQFLRFFFSFQSAHKLIDKICVFYIKKLKKQLRLNFLYIYMYIVALRALRINFKIFIWLTEAAADQWK